MQQAGLLQDGQQGQEQQLQQAAPLAADTASAAGDSTQPAGTSSGPDDQPKSAVAAAAALPADAVSAVQTGLSKDAVQAIPAAQGSPAGEKPMNKSSKRKLKKMRKAAAAAEMMAAVMSGLAGFEVSGTEVRVEKQTVALGWHRALTAF